MYCLIQVPTLSSLVIFHHFDIVSFRQAIGDFFNHYMKPAEPILAQDVSVFNFDSVSTNIIEEFQARK